MIIYKITNKLNGKCYIGPTRGDLSVRWRYHNYASSGCEVLKNAIKKYGKENFSVEEIAAYDNLEDLNNAEEYFIEWHNCIVPNGYNLKGGGGGTNLSEETLRRYSESHKGKHCSPKTEFTREKVLGKKNPFYGKKHTPESLAKMSKNRTGKCLGKEHPRYGKKHTPEAIEKMRAGHKGKIPWNKGLKCPRK